MKNNIKLYRKDRLKAILIIFLGYCESQSYVSYFKGKKEIEIQKGKIITRYKKV